MHPYTQMLLSSIPVISEEEEQLKPKKMQSRGEIPSPVNIPPGCSFHLRCPYKMDICPEVDPHNGRCWHRTPRALPPVSGTGRACDRSFEFHPRLRRELQCTSAPSHRRFRAAAPGGGSLRCGRQDTIRRH